MPRRKQLSEGRKAALALATGARHQQVRFACVAFAVLIMLAFMLVMMVDLVVIVFMFVFVFVFVCFVVVVVVVVVLVIVCAPHDPLAGAARQPLHVRGSKVAESLPSL